MRPEDRPLFFRAPAPEGRSRESTIRIDGLGKLWHDGVRVEHRGLARSLPKWVRRHPDDGRYILSNGYDWTYFTVDDVPFFVERLQVEPEHVLLCLNDETTEPWRPETTRVGRDGALYARVKDAVPGGPYDAKFSQHAQTSLAPLLMETDDASVVVRVGGHVVRVGPGGS